MSINSDDDVRYDDDYSHFRQLLGPSQDFSSLAGMCADPRDFRVDIPTTEPALYGALRDTPTVKIIPKSSQSVTIPDRKVQLLRKIGNAQAEIGRLNKLLDEIRADVLAVGE